MAKAAAKAPAKAAKVKADKAEKTEKVDKADKVEKAEKAEKVKVETVTLRHLGDALSETYNMPKKQANAMLGDMIDMVAKHLKKGARIRISGLGILQVRKRAARIGRNPATGEQIKIKASKKVAFRPAKELKESV